MAAGSLDTAQIGTGHRVPAGTLVYAIGDIHGRSDLLKKLHRRIVADAATKSASRKVIVYLGDYVDRGPDSCGVIDLILDQAPKGFTLVFLRGNHEKIMLEFLEDTSSAPVWLRNGAVPTFDSYGIRASEQLQPGDAELQRLQAELKAKLPRRHVDFLKSLQNLHVEGDYAFVHAGVKPGVALAEQREEDLLWIRGEFLASTADHGHMIVHGHTILPDVQFAPNRIGIDTGAFYSDRLTCLALEGDTRRIIQTR
jgi:serine/threonine protein phosphatase 1